MHCVSPAQAFLTPTHLCIVMEYAPGGELFDLVVKAGVFTEDEARYFFQQIIHGLDYCHQNVSAVCGECFADRWLSHVRICCSKHSRHCLHKANTTGCSLGILWACMALMGSHRGICMALVGIAAIADCWLVTSIPEIGGNHCARLTSQSGCLHDWQSVGILGELQPHGTQDSQDMGSAAITLFSNVHSLVWH
jgi:hypothetical protein